MEETIITLLEVIGTIAFAIAGALKAIEKDMDVFGVVVLGLNMAVGGGVIRDLILGALPPTVFSKTHTVLLALLTALAVFIMVKYHYSKNSKTTELILFGMDSIGLAVFSVVGVQKAFATVSEPTFFLLIFVGAITGVGGGILCDVLSGNVPGIFKKHFYACSSITGTIVCALLWNHVGTTFAMLIGMIAILLLRVVAARNHWNLPRAGIQS